MVDIAKIDVVVETVGAGPAARDLQKFADGAERAGRVSKTTVRAVARLQRELGNTGGAVTKAAQNIEHAGTRLARLQGIASDAMRGLNSISKAISTFNKLGSMISVLADFERQMSAAGTVMGATASDMKVLNSVAKDLAFKTEFTPQQVGQGLELLGRSGVSAAKAVATIPAVLDLATTSTMDLGQAVHVSSQVMSALGISATEASAVTDVLVAASLRAQVNVGQLGEAMGHVGPVARGLGLSMSDTAAAIGILSKAGIQGSSAGAGLHQILKTLANPTSQAAAAIAGLELSLSDIDPATNSLIDIVDKLAGSGLSAADALVLFGAQGGPAIMALTNQKDRLRELTGELSNVDGEAARVAGTIRDGLGGSWDSLVSSVHALVAALGDAGLSVALQVVLQLTNEVIKAVGSFVNELAAIGDGVLTALSPAKDSLTALVENVSDGFSALYAHVQPVLEALDFGMSTLIATGSVLATVMVSRAAASLAVNFVSGAMAAVRSALALQMTLGATSGASAAASLAIGGMSAALRTLRSALVTTGIGALVVGAGVLVDWFGKLVVASGGLGSAFGVLKDLAVEVFDRMTKAAKSLWHQLQAVWYESAASANENLSKAALSVEEFIDNVVNAFVGFSKAAKEIWNSIPSIVGKAAITAANSMINGIEGGINKAIDLLNGMVGQVNRILAPLGETLGKNLEIPQIDTVALQRLPDTYGDVGKDLAIRIQSGFDDSFDDKWLSGAISEPLKDNSGFLRAMADSSATLAKSSAALAGAPLQSWEKIKVILSETAVEGESANDAVDDLTNGLQNLPEPSTKPSTGLGNIAQAATGAKKATGELAKAAEEAQSKFDGMQTSLSDGATNLFSDFLVGERSFKDTLNGMGDLLRNWLKDMVRMAVANPIQFAMGLSSQGGLTRGVGNFISKIVGGFGADKNGSVLDVLMGGATPSTLMGGTGFMGGAGNVIGSTIGGFQTGGMAGGIGGFFQGTMSGISGGISSIAGGGSLLTGLSTAIGSVLPIIGIGLAIGSLFKKKKVAEGFGGEFDIDGMVGDGFSYTTSKRFLFGKSTKYGALDDERATMLNDAFLGTKDGVFEAIEALSLGAGAFDDFSAKIKINTMGLEGDEIAAKVQEELFRAFDGVTGELFDWEPLAREGEGATEVLMRLANDLITVNDAFGALGFTLYDASIAGAQAAGSFAQLFGSLEELSAATSYYFQNFYTPMEQLEHQFGQMHETLMELGINSIPTTKAEFRSLVDSMMASGKEAEAAQLIEMAPAYVQLEQMAERAAAEQSRLAQDLQRREDERRRLLEQQAREATAAAREAINARKRAVQDHWRGILDNLADDLAAAEDRLRLSEDIFSALADAARGRYLPDQVAQNVELNQANRYLRQLVGQGRITDVEALEQALSVVAEPTQDQFSTLEEYTRSFGQTSNVIDRLLTEAEGALTADEQAVALLQQQIDQANVNLQTELSALDAQLTRLTDINANTIAVGQAVTAAENAIALLNQENISAQATAVSAANANAAALLDALNQGFSLNVGGTSTTTVGGSSASGSTTGSTGQNTSTQAVYTAADFSVRPYEEGGFFKGKITSPLGGRAIVVAGSPQRAQSMAVDQISRWIQQWNQNGTQRFENGGDFGGGVRLVGERGPELEFTGPSRILSNLDSTRWLQRMEDIRAIADSFAPASVKTQALIRQAQLASTDIRPARTDSPEAQKIADLKREVSDLKSVVRELVDVTRDQARMIQQGFQRSHLQHEEGIEVRQAPEAAPLRVKPQDAHDEDLRRKRQQMKTAGVIL